MELPLPLSVGCLFTIKQLLSRSVSYWYAMYCYKPYNQKLSMLTLTFDLKAIPSSTKSPCHLHSSDKHCVKYEFLLHVVSNMNVIYTPKTNVVSTLKIPRYKCSICLFAAILRLNQPCSHI